MGWNDHQEGLDLQEALKWFYKNWERIEENTPRDDGDWVFIWGEPEYTEDILVSQFGETEAVKALAKAIEASEDNDQWVPVPEQEEKAVATQPRC